MDMQRRHGYRETRPMGRVSWKDRNRHELRNAKGFREPQSCARYLGCVRLFAAPWTAAHQAPAHGILQARILGCVAISFSMQPPVVRKRKDGASLRAFREGPTDTLILDF